MTGLKRVLGLTILVVVLTTIIVSSTVYAQKTERISFTTASSTGVWYMLGAGVGEIVSKYGGIDVETQSSQGSVANFNLLSEKQVDVGWVGASAFTKLVVEKGRDVSMMRFMMFGVSSGVQIIARKDSGIKTISDLKGKTVSVGSPGSSGAMVTAKMLEIGFGLTEENYNPVYLSFSEVAEGLRDRVIDAGTMTFAIPAALIIDLSTTVPIQVLEWDKEGREKILDSPNFRLYRSVVVPEGTYNGVDEDVTILTGPPSFTLCRADLSEDIVYNFVKAIWDNNKELLGIHPAAWELTFENTIEIFESPQGEEAFELIDIHPGALRYFEEKNYEIAK